MHAWPHHHLLIHQHVHAYMLGGLQVGQRKRKAQNRWDWLQQQAAAGGWMVPPERALVPMSVYAEMEEY